MLGWVSFVCVCEIFCKFKRKEHFSWFLWFYLFVCEITAIFAVVFVFWIYSHPKSKHPARVAVFCKLTRKEQSFFFFFLTLPLFKRMSSFLLVFLAANTKSGFGKFLATRFSAIIKRLFRFISRTSRLFLRLCLTATLERQTLGLGMLRRCFLALWIPPLAVARTSLCSKTRFLPHKSLRRFRRHSPIVSKESGNDTVS